MKELQQASIVLALAESLRQSGSWTGETHVQKGTYFLQELLDVPLGFNFILYKHGPYSFDLTDTLTVMRANQYIALEPRYPYGPSIAPGPSAILLRRLFKLSLRRYEQHVSFIAPRLAQKGVKELERLATALYVTHEAGAGARERARRIHHLKPHVSIPDALLAIETLDEIRRDAEDAGLRSDRMNRLQGQSTI